MKAAMAGSTSPLTGMTNTVRGPGEDATLEAVWDLPESAACGRPLPRQGIAANKIQRRHESRDFVSMVSKIRILGAKMKQ
jgi:hypothetical protein